MRHPVRYVVLLALPVAVALASAEPDADELERNTRLVEKYRRDDPDYYRRLRRDLRAFYRLPPEQQERMRQLDHALREQDSLTQKRLWAVLDRFGAWYDRLPEEQRRQIDEAPTREERLRVIKDLREKEFVRSLPRKVRERVDKLSGEKRAEEIARLREQEREVRLALNPEGRHPGSAGPDRPVRPSDMAPEAQAYFNKVLLPMLGSTEKKQLREAENQWPLFARTLLDLAEQHPVALPPGREPGPTLPRQLTGDAKLAYNKLTEKGGVAGAPARRREQLKAVENKWPDFAQRLAHLAKDHGIQIKTPLGPCKPDDFLPPVKTFITEVLSPALTDSEKPELAKTEGVWPDYPEKLLELSRKHNNQIPMMRLPGMDKLRDSVNSAAELPEVPDRVLREFFATELTPKERADPRLSPDDPEGRDRLRQEFFRKNPKWLTKQRDIDRKKVLNGQ